VTTPRPNRVDLHAHTTASDGRPSPLELVTAMAEAGVRFAAITDHDSVEGYRSLLARPELIPAELELVPGIEINAMTREDAHYQGMEVHVLGYGMDIDHPGLLRALAGQRGGRSDRFQQMLHQLRAHGTPVDPWIAETLPSDGTAAGRPHVARALVLAGYAESVQDAFDRFLVWGKAGYVPRSGLGPADAVELIRSAGGVPVLAHFAPAAEDPGLLDPLIEAGLLGLEVYYSGGHRPFPREVVQGLERAARDRGLLLTGGTDYHGDTMTYLEASERARVPDEVSERLTEAIRARAAVA
jgi:3',5'-nucleoside bisphosphate phosphatase